MMMINDFTALPASLKIVCSLLTLCCGVLLFLLGPRIVARTMSSTENSPISHALIRRWTHLFFLEVLAGIFCYGGLYINGSLLALPIQQALLSIAILALLCTCLLSHYI
ncbi:hypothetical protein KDH_17610 [Dictyobacter sp. S3.2.2.5]|uniref:Uncharacterized protein n=1 Tax=Dictyobacter halimunensis TaxID=3026934 RepID=A0ABQ6FPG2_9CHLR|nr:hypothetical protein KDH_17610 [Dictyobacter sp. S3.2.2.5]